ncbi:MAG: nitrate/nitrite transporter NrtS [Flavobacteriaceae bacterium]
MNGTSKWKFICQCAFSEGVPRRSLYVALVVGTILNVINQGDAIFGADPVSWLKVLLTFCVPYGVCTYGAVSAQATNIKSHGV